LRVSRETIFVIEDEPDILDVIEYNLKREGFQVQSSRDGRSGLSSVRSSPPALLILDLMLPGVDGIEICRQLKGDAGTKQIPVLIVSAKGEESDIVLGLGVGADDYISKPFSSRELIARVKAVLRRGPLVDSAAAEQRVMLGDVVVDASRHEVTVDGERVPFTATEFRLLHYMASHPGRVFTRDHLLSAVIGDDAIVIDRNIDVHVRSVRKKLGGHRDLIETIRGVGYRFADRQG
jgi:two-component system phosphate regulon response regulator PhoB